MKTGVKIVIAVSVIVVVVAGIAAYRQHKVNKAADIMDDQEFQGLIKKIDQATS
jgi:hypothetical protein